MSGIVSPERGTREQAGAAGAAEAGHARRGGRGRWWLAGSVVVVAAAAVAVAVTDPFRAAGTAGAGGTGYHTGTATVMRRSLTQQTQVDATLGDAGSYSVVNPGAGGGGGATITSLPAVGRVVRQGQVLYAVSGSPVVLLYGSVPAYRDLGEGVTGPDVTELNTDLVKLGYVTAAALGPRSGWDYFSGETAYALELLQARLGETGTGSLESGYRRCSCPGAIEVTGYGTGVVLGGPAAAGSVVLTASSTVPVVTIALDASLQARSARGEAVA